MLVANTATHYLARIVSETEQNLAKISPVKTMKPSLGLQMEGHGIYNRIPESIMMKSCLFKLSGNQGKVYLSYS